ncbi:hypothetical protein GCM10010275_19320 [Streptomyces litmocidini]|uniref:hypothetical protein n=1 Tax=Streptomyces litmocidini TaxID=67318 RepID=UPI00167ED322|nr:hypothetical protein [Streptomyces litmocidini]GGU84405.1 hypothetical protein GCM10010275_19320 [Streptomyces litmocidini]
MTQPSPADERLEAVRKAHDKFVEHAKNCPGCATSLEIGTWLAHRCPTGKRMSWDFYNTAWPSKPSVQKDTQTSYSQPTLWPDNPADLGDDLQHANSRPVYTLAPGEYL